MDVTKFQAADKLLQNDQLKQFASQTLPKLQQHTQHVQQVATAIGLPDASQAVQAGARPGGVGLGFDHRQLDRR